MASPLDQLAADLARQREESARVTGGQLGELAGELAAMRLGGPALPAPPNGTPLTSSSVSTDPIDRALSRFGFAGAGIVSPAVDATPQTPVGPPTGPLPAGLMNGHRTALRQLAEPDWTAPMGGRSAPPVTPSEPWSTHYSSPKVAAIVADMVHGPAVRPAATTVAAPPPPRADAQGALTERYRRFDEEQTQRQAREQAETGAGIVPQPAYREAPVDKSSAVYIERLWRPGYDMVEQLGRFPEQAATLGLSRKLIDEEVQYRLANGLYTPQDGVRAVSSEEQLAKLSPALAARVKNDPSYAPQYLDTSGLRRRVEAEIGAGVPVLAPDLVDTQLDLYERIKGLTPKQLPAARGFLEKLAQFGGDMAVFVGEYELMRGAMGPLARGAARGAGVVRQSGAAQSFLGGAGAAALTGGDPLTEGLTMGAVGGILGRAASKTRKAVEIGALFGAKTKMEGGDWQDVIIAGAVAPLLFSIPDLARTSWRALFGPRAALPDGSQVGKLLRTFERITDEGRARQWSMTPSEREVWTNELRATAGGLLRHHERAQTEKGPELYSKEEIRALSRFTRSYEPVTVQARVRNAQPKADTPAPETAPQPSPGAGETAIVPSEGATTARASDVAIPRPRPTEPIAAAPDLIQVRPGSKPTVPLQGAREPQADRATTPDVTHPARSDTPARPSIAPEPPPSAVVAGPTGGYDVEKTDSGRWRVRDTVSGGVIQEVGSELIAREIADEYNAVRREIETPDEPDLTQPPTPLQAVAAAGARAGEAAQLGDEAAEQAARAEAASAMQQAAAVGVSPARAAVAFQEGYRGNLAAQATMIAKNAAKLTPAIENRGRKPESTPSVLGERTTPTAPSAPVSTVSTPPRQPAVVAATNLETKAADKPALRPDSARDILERDDGKDHRALIAAAMGQAGWRIIDGPKNLFVLSADGNTRYKVQPRNVRKERKGPGGWIHVHGKGGKDVTVKAWADQLRGRLRTLAEMAPRVVSVREGDRDERQKLKANILAYDRLIANRTGPSGDPLDDASIKSMTRQRDEWSDRLKQLGERPKLITAEPLKIEPLGPGAVAETKPRPAPVSKEWMEKRGWTQEPKADSPLAQTPPSPPPMTKRERRKAAQQRKAEERKREQAELRAAQREAVKPETPDGVTFPSMKQLEAEARRVWENIKDFAAPDDSDALNAAARADGSGITQEDPYRASYEFKEGYAQLAKELRDRLPEKLHGRVRVIKKGQPGYSNANGQDIMAEIGTDAMADAILRDANDPAARGHWIKALEKAIDEHGEMMGSDQVLSGLYFLRAKEGGPTEHFAAGKLLTGDEFEIHGRSYQVVDADPGEDFIRLEDHRGSLFVARSADLWIDKDSFRPNPEHAELETLDTSFNFGANAGDSEPMAVESEPTTTQESGTMRPGWSTDLLGRPVVAPRTGKQKGMAFDTETPLTEDAKPPVDDVSGQQPLFTAAEGSSLNAFVREASVSDNPVLSTEAIRDVLRRQPLRLDDLKTSELRPAWRHQETGSTWSGKAGAEHSLDDVPSAYRREGGVIPGIEAGFTDARGAWVPLDEAWQHTARKADAEKLARTAGLIDDKTKAAFDREKPEHRERLGLLVDTMDAEAGLRDSDLPAEELDSLQASARASIEKRAGELDTAIGRTGERPAWSEEQRKALGQLRVKLAQEQIDQLIAEGKIKPKPEGGHDLQDFQLEELEWLRRAGRTRPVFGMGAAPNVPETRNPWKRFVDHVAHRIKNAPTPVLRRTMGKIGRAIYKYDWNMTAREREAFERVRGRKKYYSLIGERLTRQVDEGVERRRVETGAPRLGGRFEGRWLRQPDHVRTYWRQLEDLIRGDREWESLTDQQRSIAAEFKRHSDELTDEILLSPWMWPHLKAWGFQNIEEMIALKRAAGLAYLRRIYDHSILGTAQAIAEIPAPPEGTYSREVWEAAVKRTGYYRPDEVAVEMERIGPRIRGGMYQVRRGDEQLWTVMDRTEREVQTWQFTSKELAAAEHARLLEENREKFGESVEEKIKLLDPFSVDDMEKHGLLRPVRDIRLLMTRTLVDSVSNLETLKLFQTLRDTVASGTPLSGHVRLPNSPAMGPLRDLWVPEGTARAIFESEQVHRGLMASLWRSYLYGWKASKTVLNPSTWGRQLYGTLIFQALDGMNPVTDARWIARALKLWRSGLADPEKADPAFRRMVEANELQTGWTEGDLSELERRVFEDLDGVYSARVLEWIDKHQQAAVAIAAGRDKARAAMHSVGRWYDLVDNVAKLASYLKKTEGQGMSHEEAIRRLWMYPNYERVGGAARRARNAWWGAPFVAFTDQAVKATLRAARETPLRLLALIGAVGAANMISRLLLGVDDAEMELIDSDPNRSRSWVDRYFQPLLPVRDDRGRPMPLDLRWIYPLAADLRVNAAGGGLSIPFLFGQPHVTAAAELMFNRDAFTGRTLTDGADDPVGVWTAISHLAAELAPLPPLVASGMKRIYDSAVGNSEKPLWQVVAKEVFGVSIRNPWMRRGDVLKLLRDKLGERKAEQFRTILQAYNSLYRKPWDRRPKAAKPITGEDIKASLRGAARAEREKAAR